MSEPVELRARKSISKTIIYALYVVQQNEKLKLCEAAVKNRVLTRIDSCFEVPVLHMCTTARLSQCTRRRLLPHWAPQVTAASSTAYSSFHWMECRRSRLDQVPLSQWPFQ